jgi:hypothetical protein
MWKLVEKEQNGNVGEKTIECEIIENEMWHLTVSCSSVCLHIFLVFCVSFLYDFTIICY